MDADELAASVAPFFPAVGLDAPRDRAYVARVLPTLKERGKTFRELLEVGRFYFERPRDYAREAADTYFTEAGAGGAPAVVAPPETLPRFTPDALECLYRDPGAGPGLKLGDLAQLTRLGRTR